MYMLTVYIYIYMYIYTHIYILQEGAHRCEAEGAARRRGTPEVGLAILL